MAPNHGGDPLGSILGPMGSHWVQKMGQNRKKLRKFEFWGMVFFYRFDPFFLTQWDHIGPWMGPRVPHRDLAPITLTSIFLEKSMTAGKWKIRILVHGNFLGFWPIHFAQWDPIGPKMDPRGSPP